MSTSARLDPRLAFLAGASARLALVEAGAMDLDEALSPDFIEQSRSEILQRMEAVHRKLCEQRLRDWRWKCRP